MVPAVEGTRNVLRAAKAAGGVRRVVMTSSISAIVPSPGWPAGEVRDERCWTDIDYCEKNGVRLSACVLGNSSLGSSPSMNSELFFFSFSERINSELWKQWHRSVHHRLSDK